MTAIFKREFRALFCNVTGWIFIGVTMAFYGLYFTLYHRCYCICHASYGADSYHAYLLGRTQEQDGPVDYDSSGIHHEDCPWQVFRLGCNLYHLCGIDGVVPIAVIFLWGSAVLDRICGTAWFLFLWINLPCNRHVCFFFDRESAD